MCCYFQSDFTVFASVNPLIKTVCKNRVNPSKLLSFLCITQAFLPKILFNRQTQEKKQSLSFLCSLNLSNTTSERRNFMGLELFVISIWGMYQVRDLTDCGRHKQILYLWSNILKEQRLDLSKYNQSFT